MSAQVPAASDRPTGLGVRAAVIWRSGSQIAAQLVAWSATFVVIRLLDPADYGLFALTQTVLVLLNLMNGYGIANALIRQKQVSERELRQALGLLILLNGGLALLQFILAPAVADLYNQPAIIDLLRVQSLLYLATPFLALPYAILSRRMDFRRQAQIRMFASLCGALTAIACALAGWGIWTLVAAPMVLFYVEAIGMTVAARCWMLPLFRFDGARELLRYGGAMTLVQGFWFLQTQADIFLAGRAFDAYSLGIYATALFLSQLLVTKFVPPINDVAFAAYSRMHDGSEKLGPAFLTSARLVLLIAMPFYVGMALTAEPLIATVLGEKWRDTAAIVPILALAMPFMALQILFAPATNALGRPGIAVRVSIAGGVILPLAFLVGIGGGVSGLAWAWVAGMAGLLAVTMFLSAKALEITWTQTGRAVAPAVFGAAAMALLVAPLTRIVDPLPPLLQLALLVGAGVMVYAIVLILFARRTVEEAFRLLTGRGA